DGPLKLQTELSVASARLALDGALPFDRGGVMISIRRTFLDWFTDALNIVRDDDRHIPFDFSDALARVDLNLVRGARIEASGISERDHLRGDFPNILQRNKASWGNRAGRVTLIVPFSKLETRLTVGGTRFGTELIEEPIVPGS